jgi:hypothetical protein
MTEERQIDVDVSTDTATVIFWKSEITLAPNRAEANVTGTDYKGLGMRFVPAMDHGDTFVCGENQFDKATIGDKQLVQAPWCAYTVEVNGKPVTVAAFGHPSNARPVTWLIMLNPYPLLTGSLSLHTAPMILTQDRPMVLRYGLALWDERVSPNQIEEVYRDWLAKAGQSDPDRHSH